MTRPSFLIDVRQQRGGDLERDLRNGGLFVPGAQHPLNLHVEVTFRFHDAEQSVAARVVFSDVQGVGLELFVPGHERAVLLERVRWTREQPMPEPAPVPKPEAPRSATSAAADDEGFTGDLDEGGGGDGDDEDLDESDEASGATGPADRPSKLAELRRKRAEARLEPVHVRVRNLSMAEQLKLAHQGEQQERILLERLYGKSVWEALLRNPRITAPEVARIGRMGALPKPLLEIIVGNSGWLQIPEIRRALLGNPRLAPEMIVRVLRLLPKHELKIVPGQLAYPAAVRDVARRMLKD